jgi:RND family efflux transporter MFP subunit
MSVRRSSRPRDGKLLPVVLIVGFIAMLVAGAIPRLARSKARDEERALVVAIPTVFTETVHADTGGLGVDVPGSVQGLHETSIYARSNGFVKSLRVDIGSVVRRGDTLLTLDMPEVKEQAQQAAAVLEQAEASAALARTTLARWKQLADKGVVTPQEFEERQATANVTEANARAARASVANLREVLRFGALTAPFNGIVTARSIDLGSLVTAGTTATARPLLTVVQTDTIRVMVQVPQSAAPRVTPGLKTAVHIRELGDSAFMGTVVRTAGAMDVTTRSLLTEIHIVNPSRRILPGMFSAVKLRFPGKNATLRIPAIALIVRADGPQVAKVVHDTVHLTKITLGRDFGTTVEAVSGLSAGDEVVVNPAENLTDGMAVKAVSRSKKGGTEKPATNAPANSNKD